MVRARRSLETQLTLGIFRRPGKIDVTNLGNVIKSDLQEDIEMFALKSFPIQGEGILRIIKSVTEHFKKWYEGPPTPRHWASLLHQPEEFVPHAASKGIFSYSDQAIMKVPGATHVYENLAKQCTLPSSLAEFQSAVAGHWGWTYPGATD